MTGECASKGRTFCFFVLSASFLKKGTIRSVLILPTQLFLVRIKIPSIRLNGKTMKTVRVGSTMLMTKMVRLKWLRLQSVSRIEGQVLPHLLQ